MSYTPYITGTNQQTNSSSYGPGGTTGTTFTSSNHGAPSQTTISNNAYGQAPTALATTGSYNPYQTLSKGTTMTTISSNIPSGAAPTAPLTRNYTPYESIPLAMASSPYGTSFVPSATSPSTSSNLPSFSKALHVPQPTNPASYGYSNNVSPSKCGSSAVVTAYPVTDAGHSPEMPGMRLVNSMTYQGGPTHGLVSEGNPVKCHKVDYEIKGHEMQLVECVLKST
jgi:hypothetical protein